VSESGRSERYSEPPRKRTQTGLIEFPTSFWCFNNRIVLQAFPHRLAAQLFEVMIVEMAGREIRQFLGSESRVGGLRLIVPRK
jgi:hypothetical protein